MERKMNEDLTKGEVRSVVDDKIADYVKSREFKRDINKIIADALEKYFRIMYNKRTLWRAEIANG